MVQYMRPVKDSSEVAAGALGSYTLKSAFSSSQKAGALAFSPYHILLRTVSRNNQEERWRGREREGKRDRETEGGDYACHVCLAINLTAARIPAHGLNQENIG